MRMPRVTPSRQPELSGGVKNLFAPDDEECIAEVHSVNFAALVQHYDFIESFFDGFANGPNIIQSRKMVLTPVQGDAGVPPVFTDGRAHRFAMFGETRRANNENSTCGYFSSLCQKPTVL